MTKIKPNISPFMQKFYQNGPSNGKTWSPSTFQNHLSENPRLKGANNQILDQNCYLTPQKLVVPEGKILIPPFEMDLILSQKDAPEKREATEESIPLDCSMSVIKPEDKMIEDMIRRQETATGNPSLFSFHGGGRANFVGKQYPVTLRKYS
jgi:hypothetical protein